MSRRPAAQIPGATDTIVLLALARKFIILDLSVRLGLADQLQ